MKSFKFRYSGVVWILLALVTILSFIGLGWNIFSLTEYFGINQIKTVSHFIMSGLCALLAFTTLSIIIYGRYKIKKGCLITYLGYLKSKVKIQEVTELVHFTKSNKLVAYYKDDKYSIIVISPEDYDDFVLAMREVNAKIVYSKRIDGEQTPL